ncbi:hypothetical protein ACX04_23360, partial [Vibrio parahaemolyticus]
VKRSSARRWSFTTIRPTCSSPASSARRRWASCAAISAATRASWSSPGAAGSGAPRSTAPPSRICGG